KAKVDRLAVELIHANEKLSELVARDGLTGLYNHRRFQEALRKEVSEAARYSRPLSLILFDIYQFKRVNDTHGHLAGDAVLKNVAALAQSTFRATDLVARYGGEEFAVILTETREKEAAVAAERVRRGIEALETRVGGTVIRVT